MNIAKPKILYIIVIIVTVVVALGLYWYFGRGGAKKIETTEEALEVLSETPSVTVETNPIKKVPDLNPVEKVNPFKTSNPFQ